MEPVFPATRLLQMVEFANLKLKHHDEFKGRNEQYKSQ